MARLAGLGIALVLPLRCAVFHTIQLADGEWYGRGGEFFFRSYLQPATVVVKNLYVSHPCMCAGLLRTDIPVVVLVGDFLDVMPNKSCRIAVAVVLPRSLAVEVNGAIGLVHRKLHPVSEQVGQRLDAAGIFHYHLYVNFTKRSHVINDF